MAGFEEARARKALEDAGLDYRMPLERASSVTNEVWIAEDYVVRVNRHPNQRLRREALLGPQLPDDVAYPPVVAYGGNLGADWLICRRVSGLVLSRCWPAMTRGERREAVRQLSTHLLALHEFPFPDDLPEATSPQLLGPAGSLNPVAPLLEGLARARELDHVDAGLIQEAERIVRDTAPALDPWQHQGSVHGDLHFENILWDGTRVTALLDLEYAQAAPSDLELDVFLRFCAYPYLCVAEDYEHLTLAADYTEVPFWLAEDHPAMFSHPRQFDRVRLYAIAFDVRDLLASPPSRRARDLSEHHACNRLAKVVRGTSHLDRLATSRSSNAS